MPVSTTMTLAKRSVRRLELGEAQQNSLLKFGGGVSQVGDGLLQVLLSGHVVVDRVEYLGGDALGLLAFDIGVRECISQ